MGKTHRTGLVAKSRRRLANSIVFGLCVFLCFYWFGKKAVDYLTVGSEEAYLSRDWLTHEFETYVRLKAVAANDYASIEAFRTEDCRPKARENPPVRRRAGRPVSLR